MMSRGSFTMARDEREMSLIFGTEVNEDKTGEYHYNQSYLYSTELAQHES